MEQEYKQVIKMMTESITSKVNDISKFKDQNDALIKQIGQLKLEIAKQKEAHEDLTSDNQVLKQQLKVTATYIKSNLGQRWDAIEERSRDIAACLRTAAYENHLWEWNQKNQETNFCHLEFKPDNQSRSVRICAWKIE